MSNVAAPGIVKNYAAASVFQPTHLLREARRQKGLPERNVPGVCVLDPDGDFMNHLRATGQARPSPGWACYHTDLAEFDLPDGTTVGIVGRAVGAPFAVLVAEQLFASGCYFLLSITSAGRIVDLGEPPYVVLIDKALRDEGTSSHYVPLGADPFIAAPQPALLDRVAAALHEVFAPAGIALHRGAAWTTDAPFRETASAIMEASQLGALAVEMEAAALYAMATRNDVPVICLAHVTNTMGQSGGEDFEKGEADGSVTALLAVQAAVRAFQQEAKQ